MAFTRCWRRNERGGRGDGEWGEWPALAAIAAFGKRRTRAKASVCVVATSAGLKGPLPRTEVRGFHRAGLLPTKCCRACLSKWTRISIAEERAFLLYSRQGNRLRGTAV